MTGIKLKETKGIVMKCFSHLTAMVLFLKNAIVSFMLILHFQVYRYDRNTNGGSIFHY